MPFKSFYTASTDFEYPEDEPVEDNEFRERALEMIRVLSLALTHVINSKSPQVTAYGVAYAIGLTSVLGNTKMSDRAQILGVNRSALTRAATKFLEESGLPPSIFMQQVEHAPSDQHKKHRNDKIMAQYNRPEQMMFNF